jgi:uncharacterized protein
MARFVACVQPAFEADDETVEAKTVEKENVARLRGMYEALTKGDANAFPTLLAEDIELTITGPPTLAMVGSWKGRDQVLQAAAVNFARLEDQKPELLSVTAQGDQVAVVAREQGRLTPSGKSYDVHWLQLFTIREGRITRILEFCDDPEAFRD